LEIWLQEETLDELEKIAENPQLLRRRRESQAVFDFTRVHDSGFHYVFLEVEPRDEQQVLFVLTVGHFVRR